MGIRIKSKMEILIDKEEILGRLTDHIRRYGHEPEHHPYLLFYYDVAKGYQITYFDFKEQGGIIAYRKGGLWRMVSGPITAPHREEALFQEALRHIFKNCQAKKITLEDWTEESRVKILKNIGRRNLRATKPFYVLSWPVYDLRELDDALAGKKLKGMRYARNRFLNSHEVAIRDLRAVDTEEAIKLVTSWGKKRSGRDTVYAGEYIRMIENGFPGCDIAHAIFIDAKLSAMSAGWGIPNSKGYYSFLDIHDYSDPYLGEFAGLTHFLEVKKRSYEFLDYGGSDAPLLNFKKKFHPARIYKTYNFSIVRDDSRT